MNKNTWQLTEKTEDWGRKDENGMKIKKIKGQKVLYIKIFVPYTYFAIIYT